MSWQHLPYVGEMLPRAVDVGRGIDREFRSGPRQATLWTKYEVGRKEEQPGIVTADLNAILRLERTSFGLCMNPREQTLDRA